LLCLINVNAQDITALETEVQGDTTSLREYMPKLFLDTKTYIDENYLKTEVKFVNYVIESKEADIHLLITRETTAGGGGEYTLLFIGRNKFEGTDFTLKYCSKMTDTDDQIRKGIVKIIKLGLVPYTLNTPISEYLTISFIEEEKAQEVKDPWNNWVFEISISGHLSGQETSRSHSIYGSLSVSHITPKNKFELYTSLSSDKDYFDLGDAGSITSTSKSKYFNIMYVYSVDDHWSCGMAECGIGSFTYNNRKLTIGVVPAIEFNIFPYSESSTKEFKFRYMIAPGYIKYYEETLYDKMEEILFKELLLISYSLKTTWGSIYTSIAGSHYFHDFARNNINSFTTVSFRLFKGFSINFSGYYSRVRDQLSLPKGEVSEEEILLMRRELASQYNYWMSVGFSYSFGSIYSNIVNTRFN
jgi:hypothetical protein